MTALTKAVHTLRVGIGFDEGVNQVVIHSIYFSSPKDDCFVGLSVHVSLQVLLGFLIVIFIKGSVLCCLVM